LEAIGIAFERVSAVNGLDVPADLRDQFFIDDSDFTHLSVGEVGCYASHLVVFQKMLADGLPWALILEDDAIIEPNAKAVVEEAVAAAPNGWDIIKVCNKPKHLSIRYRRLSQGKLVRFRVQPVLTTGYIVSAAGATKFLSQRPRVRPIDMDFRRTWEFGTEVLGVLPPIVSIDDRASSVILEMGGREAKAALRNTTQSRRDRQRARIHAEKMLGPLRVRVCKYLDRAIHFIPRRIRPRGMTINI
jgi:glycosyl transferase family 25